MNARKKINNLLGKAMGFVGYVFDEAKKSYDTTSTAASTTAASSGRGNPNEMIRVTDSAGNEYLCPIGKLREANFVSEREKTNCLDYGDITHHAV